MTVHVKWTREGWGGGEGREIEGGCTCEMDQGRLGRRGGKGKAGEEGREGGRLGRRGGKGEGWGGGEGRVTVYEK